MITFIGLFALSLQVPSPVFADDEVVTAVCDCPELEGLSTDVQGILERIYSDQGQIPPLGFDEFNVTLALQVNAAGMNQNCLERMGVALNQEQANEMGIGLPTTDELNIRDEAGNSLDVRLSYIREASLNGRITVFYGQLNNVDYVFVLRRNLDGEIDIESFPLNENVEEATTDPAAELNQLAGPNPGPPGPPPPPPSGGKGGSPPGGALPGGSPGLLPGAPAPLDGDEVITRANPRPDGVGVETYIPFEGDASLRLSGDISETRYLDEDLEEIEESDYRFQLNGELAFGENGIRAEIVEDRNADGTVISRTTGVGLRFGEHGDGEVVTDLMLTRQGQETPGFEFGITDAGPGGQAIDMIQGSLMVQRPTGPSLFQGMFTDPNLGFMPAETTPQGEEENYFALEGTGTVRDGLRTVELSFGDIDHEGSQYSILSYDLQREATSFYAGAGDEDSRFNFQLFQSQDEGVSIGFNHDSLTELEAEENGDVRRQVLSFQLDRYPGSEPVAGFSYDRIVAGQETGEPFANGDQRIISDATMVSLDYSTDESGRVQVAVMGSEQRISPEAQGDPEISQQSYYAHIGAGFEGEEYGIDAYLQRTHGSFLGEQGVGVGFVASRGPDGERVTFSGTFTNTTGTTVCNETTISATYRQGFTAYQPGETPLSGGAPGDFISCNVGYANIDGENSMNFSIDAVRQGRDGFIRGGVEAILRESDDPTVRINIGGEIRFKQGPNEDTKTDLPEKEENPDPTEG